MKQYLFVIPIFIMVFGAIGVNLSNEEWIPAKPAVIDLSGQNLTELPESYKEQILQAEVLILDNNHLVQLPVWLAEANSLRRISLNNNPEFDFFKFCVDFQEMKNIDELSAENCNIKNIPYQLTFLTHLKSLDLSGNLINHVPYHFSFLTQMEHCDLSANQITETGYAFQDLQKLRNLDISSNPQLNTKDFCYSFQYHEMDYLKIDFQDSIPEIFADIKCQSLDIGVQPGTVTNDQISKNNCSSFYIRNLSSNGLSERLADEISSMNSVKKLGFSGFNLQQIPAKINGMKSLQELDLSGAGLSSVDQLSHPNLKTLIIQENNLSLEQIGQLKKEMPQCAIFSDEEKLKGLGVSFNIAPPIKNVVPPVEKKNIDPKKDDVFISETGTTVLQIPANAFLDENGKVVTTPVEISFTEYNDPVTVALSGIPMQIKNEDGTTGDFSSAGMFKLEATSNGKSVFPNPNSLIRANIISKQTTPYNLYTFQESKGWTLAQANPIVPATSESGNNLLATTESIDYTIYYELERLKRAMGDTNSVRRGNMFETKVGLYKYRKSASRQSFTFTLKVLSMEMNGRLGTNQFHYPYAEEMKEVLKTPFQYNDYHYTKHARLMDSINADIRKAYFPSRRDRRKIRKKEDKYFWNENVVLKDISLTPDPEKDDYIFRFNYRGKMHQFHVILDGESGQAKNIQKMNEVFMQNYMFADKKNKEAREKVLKEYENFYENEEKRVRKIYEENKKAFEAKKIAYAEQMKKNNLSFEQFEKRRIIETGMAYSFEVAQFGISNCDIVSRFARPGAVKGKFKDVFGKTLLFIRMIRIDKVKNMITYIEPREQLIIDYGHNETALLFIIDENNIGIVDSKSLSDGRNQEEIEVKIIPAADLKPEKVRSML